MSAIPAAAEPVRAADTPNWQRPLLWLALVLLVFWLAGLGLAPLFDVDEGAFSEASREMLSSGDWGHTTLSGTDRFDKPILIYWFQAASLAVFGVNEWATRLPSALAGWGWCMALALFAAPRWGVRVAVLAAGMLATSVGPMLIGRAATADSMLNLLLTLTLLDLWRAVEQGAANPWPLRRAALWMGLGLLDKGPVAVVVPGGALGLWWLLSPLAAQRWPLARRLLTDGRAGLITLVVAVPWYAYALNRHGMAFIDGFLLKHNLDRFSGPLEGHGGSPLYYVVVMPLLLLPWSVLLVPLLARVRRLWVDDTSRFLLLWAGFVIGFFSVSGTKLPHYVLYGMAPLVLLMARLWADVAHERWRGWGVCAALLVLSALALLGLTAAAPQLAARLQTSTADAHWQTLLAAAAAKAAPATGWLALAALLVLGLALQAWRRPQQAPLALLGAVLVASVAWSTLMLPWWGDALQGPVRELALRARADNLPLVQWRLHQPSAAFYRQASAPRRAPEVGEAALMRSDHYADLPPDEQRQYDRLAQAPGFVLVRRH